MRAIVYDHFGELPEVREVSEPKVAPHAALIEVAATGLCRSDWHAWQGHDPDVSLPGVGGHEFAGVVVEVGAQVRGWRPGQRVTASFTGSCGHCAQCVAGEQQVCENQRQPGFTYWGSFADRVVVDHADVNLVLLPDSLDFATAATLGCRFATAFRAVLRQGRIAAGDWVAVHGCGGAGLSAVMIAAAAGARVIAVDISAAALDLARELGAEEVVDASIAQTAPEEDPGAIGTLVSDLADGGVQLSLDCLGSPRTCAASVLSLARRGRHVQVGLLPSGPTPVPMDRVVAFELEILGSHGLAAHDYPAMLGLVESGRLRPQSLIRRRIGLEGIPEALAAMSAATPATPGVTVALPRGL